MEQGSSVATFSELSASMLKPEQRLCVLSSKLFFYLKPSE
jgi:hypothetical protein